MPDEKLLNQAQPQLDVVRKKRPAESNIEPQELGKRVKEIRLQQNLTLEEASKLTGLARSTLSKIENEQISPTFSAVSKLVKGLGIDIPQLFAKSDTRTGSGGRRDITLAGEGKARLTPTYEHRILGSQLLNKKMLPYHTTIRARTFEEFDGWVRHQGEELLYVLSGSIIFYTEFYEPIHLTVGDSAYYDCEMGHAVTSTSSEDAEILWVTA
ncbi:MAG: helix-turn-helix domain-containing protein [Pseudomonadales bacterium]|nr:helix-turn-helix domain-containing protein [Pseudomonadales bacterium]NRA17830.1 helix-turn-helix domain-containing protein [Oceanospirillaceae bacterium]